MEDKDDLTQDWCLEELGYRSFKDTLPTTTHIGEVIDRIHTTLHFLLEVFGDLEGHTSTEILITRIPMKSNSAKQWGWIVCLQTACNPVLDPLRSSKSVRGGLGPQESLEGALKAFFDTLKAVVLGVIEDQEGVVVDSERHLEVVREYLFLYRKALSQLGNYEAHPQKVLPFKDGSGD